MIMRISDSDNDGFFGDGVRPTDDIHDLFRAEVTNWRFVALDPGQLILRADAAHTGVPVPHMNRAHSRNKADAEQFNESLYFG